MTRHLASSSSKSKSNLYPYLIPTNDLSLPVLAALENLEARSWKSWKRSGRTINNQRFPPPLFFPLLF